MTKEELENIIHNAGEAQKVLRIRYRDKKDRVETRNVEPYEIKNDHLFAYCRKRKGIRQFHLERIESAKQTNYPYFPKWPIKLGEAMDKTASQTNPWVYRIANLVFGDYYNPQVE